MAKDFITKQRERTIIEFTLDGEPFSFTPPKKAQLIMSAITTIGLDKASTDGDSVRDLLNWLGEGLGDEQAERVLGRLRDPDDDFDLDAVNDIARHLLGQSSNRPTRRRSG
jgi:hypothetical protein